MMAIAGAETFFFPIFGSIMNTDILIFTENVIFTICCHIWLGHEHPIQTLQDSLFNIRNLDRKQIFNNYL